MIFIQHAITDMRQKIIFQRYFNRSIVILFIFAMVVLLPLNSFGGKKYTMTDFGLGKAFDINNYGLVVGYSGEWGQQQAFVWEDGVMTILGPGHANGINDLGIVVGYSAGGSVIWENGNITRIDVQGLSRAIDINNSGKIIGDYKYDNFERSYILIDGILTDIGSLGGETHVHGINDSGQVAGGSKTDQNETFSTRAFIWEDNVMTNIGMIERYSYANAINASGHVVGDSLWYAFIWKDSLMSALGYGHANGINDSGQVVGDSLTETGAVLWEDGNKIYLEDVTDVVPGFVFKTAYAINNEGQIVGYGKIENQDHAFLLTPIPCSEFLDEDGDVDGSDLAFLVSNFDEACLEVFAEMFGQTN